MTAFMNRRAWLKNTTLLTGGFSLLPAAFEKLSAHTAPVNVNRCQHDFDLAATAPPDLKARLFANENPFGPSEKAKKAIIDALPTSYQYPMYGAQQLEAAIRASEGLGSGMVMMSAGSTPLLQAAGMFYGKNGGGIVAGDPSYDDLPEHAEELGAKWIKVPLTAEYKLDLDAMEKAIDSNTKLVYICNPNNPTGTVLETAQLKAFCERVSKKVTVFVDEAYIDYLPDPKSASLIDSVKKGQNIIVARTFSKLYGFAGLRVGYIVAQPATIKSLDPYCVGVFGMSATSISAATAAYNDTDFLQDALKKTLASRDYLYKVLKEEGYDYIPSSANFVMFPIKMDGQRFAGEMFKRGVGLRNWKFNGKHWCRISIGRMDEMQAFAEAFKQIS